MLDDLLQHPPHQWTTDAREPVYELTLGEDHYALYLMSVPFWLEILALIVSEAVVASLVGVIVYYGIVQASTPTSKALVGYGLVLPLLVIGPKLVIDGAGMENLIFRFCMAVISPTTAIFRTTAAVHGFLPPHAVRSVGYCAFYFGSALLIRYDTDNNVYVRAPWSSTLRHLGNFLILLILTGILQSLFDLTEGLPNFGDGPQPHWYSLDRVLDLHQYRHNLAYAILFQFYLTTFAEGLVAATQIVTGRQPEAIMDNPLFASESPSDFWGRRWNLLIHDCLKRGVYKPVRSMGGSAGLAIAAAFLASGAFHEWLLPVVMTEFPHTHGPTIMFFLWQAGLVAGEILVLRSYKSTPMRDWPTPVKTACVVAAGLPLAHWFCDSYVHSEFFLQGSMAFITIGRI